MKTNTLTITSGYNYQSGSWVTGCGTDPYWAVTSSANGDQVPMCARVYGPWVPPPPFNFANGWQAIGVECSNQDVQCNSLTCNALIQFPDPIPFYTLRRRFFVDIPFGTTIQATINVTVGFDDRIFNFFVNGVDLGSTPCVTSGGTATYNDVITLNSGINSIDVNIINRGVALFPANPMRFAISGTISTTNPDIINNQWYVPNAFDVTQFWGCTFPTAWLDTPRFQGNCFLAGVNTDTIVITNAVNGIAYDVTPGSMLPGDTSWIGTNGVTYTITATDAMGCTLSSEITATNSKPILTITPEVSCTTSLSLAAYTFIDISANGGGGDIFEFNLLYPNNVYIGTAPADTVIQNQIFPGKYIIHTINNNGCENIDSVVYNYVEPPIATAVPDICEGETITLEVTNTNTPSIPPSTISYSWGPPVNSSQNPVSYTPTTFGPSTYTCTATSSFGCTATTVVTNIMHVKPVIEITTDNAPCNPSFTATANTGLPGNWSWVGFPNVTWSVPNQPSMTVNAPPNTVFPNLQTNTYTVYLTDMYGCKDTIDGIYNEKPFCCNPSQLSVNGTKAFSSHSSYNNGTAADIISAFATNTITTPDFILFDGIITIDQNVSFINCPKIRMHPNCEIILTNNATLSFINCNVQSSCDYMWQGISASTTAQKIIINNSRIRDMNSGIRVSNGAKIDVLDSEFENNYIGIQIQNAPSNYTQLNGNCQIRRTSFESDMLTNLLPPHASQQRGEFGIRIHQSKTCEIGSLTPNEFNFFRNLYCGISILQRNTDAITTETYILNNNKFENIQDEPGIATSAVSEYQIASTWPIPTITRGCAIHATPILPYPLTLPPIHRLLINYSFNPSVDLSFWKCDKAVIGHYSSAVIRNAVVEETLEGFMFQNSASQQFLIRDNIFGMYDQTNILQAIYTNSSNGAAPGNRDISFNSIRLRESPVDNGTIFFYPIGISSNNLISGTNASNVMMHNDIGIFADAGRGIQVANGGPGTRIDDNRINIYSWQPSYVPVAIATGIYLNNSKNVQIRRNKITGNSTLLGSIPNDFSCMRLVNSPDCFLECNESKYTRIGLHVIGNCTTVFDRMKGNHFFQHGNGIRFGDFTWGTLNVSATGNIGPLNGNFNPLLDNNNTFVQANLFNTPLNRAIFSCTNATNPTGFWYTTTLPFTTAGSFPSLTGGYDIFPISTNNVFEDCPQEENLLFNNLAVSFSENEAISIANGNYNLSEDQPVTVEWMIDKELFEVLSTDTSLLNNSIPLLNFYSDKLTTYTDEIVEIDHLLSLFADSTVNSNESLVTSIRAQIESFNSAIGGLNTMELNEKWVNTVLLQSIENGIGAMSYTDKNTLEQLAKSCPYLNGTAVYKARSLYDFYEPHFCYNDVVLCQSSNSNKTSMAFEATIDGSGLALRDNSVTVYPNPATNHITLIFSDPPTEDMLFTLRDIAGKVQKEVLVAKGSNYKQIPLPQLDRGIYIYTCSTNKEIMAQGKLTIQ